MERNIYSGPPTNVAVEASWDTCNRLDLDTLNGEQYDHFRNVISIVDNGEGISFETTRSWEAWKAGEPNAGRGRWTIPHAALERVLIDGEVVWGTALDRI